MVVERRTTGRTFYVNFWGELSVHISVNLLEPESPSWGNFIFQEFNKCECVSVGETIASIGGLNN